MQVANTPRVADSAAEDIARDPRNVAVVSTFNAPNSPAMPNAACSPAPTR